MEDVRALLEGREGEKLRALADSAPAKELGKMIDPAAAEKAVKAGDVEALRQMMSSIMDTEQGKKLAADISRAMGK